MFNRILRKHKLSVITFFLQILINRERLIRRSQLRRSAYHILAESKQQTSTKKTDAVEKVSGAEVKLDTADEVTPSGEHMKEYHEEIFDDDDFYHQLLRELIERKANESNNPQAVGR